MVDYVTTTMKVLIGYASEWRLLGHEAAAAASAVDYGDDYDDDDKDDDKAGNDEGTMNKDCPFRLLVDPSLCWCHS